MDVTFGMEKHRPAAAFPGQPFAEWPEELGLFVRVQHVPGPHERGEGDVVHRPATKEDMLRYPAELAAFKASQLPAVPPPPPSK